MAEVSQVRVRGTLYDIKDTVARRGSGSSPAVASTAAGMTDTSKIYVYTGSETGYTAGNWYYYDGTSWVSGGIYQSSGIETDTTLAVSGAAADSKATGDAINNVIYVGSGVQDSHTRMLVSPTSSELEVVTKTEFDTELSDLKSQIGNLNSLETEAKTDLVSAINEAAQTGGSSGDGLTSAIKSALLQLAQKVAYVDDDGQTYYDDLYDALYPAIIYTAITLNKSSLSFGSLNTTQSLVATTTPIGGDVTWSSSDESIATVSQTGVVTSVGYGDATITATCGSLTATCSVDIVQATLTSISASYTQSGTVYDTDSLDTLKAGLRVTATWSNGSTSTVASGDYTLTGTLTEGISTITVSYSGKTTTFNVNVTHNTNKFVGHLKFNGSYIGVRYLIALIQNTGFEAGSQFVYSVSGKNWVVTPTISDAVNANYYFGDNTGEVSNGKISQEGPKNNAGKEVIQTSTGYTAKSTFSYTVLSPSTSPYLKISLPFTSQVEFDIESISVNVNGTDVEILKLGGFSSNESVTITQN